MRIWKPLLLLGNIFEWTVHFARRYLFPESNWQQNWLEVNLSHSELSFSVPSQPTQTFVELGKLDEKPNLEANDNKFTSGFDSSPQGTLDVMRFSGKTKFAVDFWIWSSRATCNNCSVGKHEFGSAHDRGKFCFCYQTFTFLQISYDVWLNRTRGIFQCARNVRQKVHFVLFLRCQPNEWFQHESALSGIFLSFITFHIAVVRRIFLQSIFFVFRSRKSFSFLLQLTLLKRPFFKRWTPCPAISDSDLIGHCPKRSFATSLIFAGLTKSVGVDKTWIFSTNDVERSAFWCGLRKFSFACLYLKCSPLFIAWWFSFSTTTLKCLPMLR